MKADSGVTYHGYWSENDGSVISIEDGRGARIGIVQHLAKHSPTRMNWGYCGSGPADTARSLLIATLGDEATCLVCRGTDRVGAHTVPTQTRAALGIMGKAFFRGGGYVSLISQARSRASSEGDAP